MDVAQTGARLLAEAGALWLLGLLVVSRLVLPSAPAAAAGSSWAVGRDRLRGHLVRSLDLALLAVAAGAAASFAVQVAAVRRAGLAESTAGAAALASSTAAGRAAVAAAAVAVALALAVRPGLDAHLLPDTVLPRGRREIGRVLAWSVLSGALVLVLTLSGHAGSTGRSAGAGVLHVTTAAVWLTGVGVLGALLPSALTGQRARTQARVLAPLLARFARLAAAATAVLLLSGLVTAGALLSWEDLRTTDYGRVLLVKLWLVAAALLLGGLNHLLLVPRLVAAVHGRAGDEAARMLAVAVSAEVVLGTTVLVVTAALSGTSPP